MAYSKLFFWVCVCVRALCKRHLLPWFRNKLLPGRLNQAEFLYLDVVLTDSSEVCEELGVIAPETIRKLHGTSSISSMCSV